jgi:type I restriction enzyme R subunit
LQLDERIRTTKQADWHGDRMKERQIAKVVREELVTYHASSGIGDVMNLIKAQKEYE